MTIKVDWSKETTHLLDFLVTKSYTIQQVADFYGVSRQRVFQVIRHYLPELSETSYGKRKETIDRKVRKTEARRRYFGRSVCRGMTELERTRSKILITKKNNVRCKGQIWDVDMTDFWWPEYCPVLGIKLNYVSPKALDDSPSFDRKDNSKGYITGNVFIISQKANRIKSNATVEDLLRIINYMQKN
jgi:hypothetical protein